MIGLRPVASHGAVEERGNLVLDNIPAVDTPLTARLDDYLNARGASFVDWLPDGGAADRHALRRRRAVASRGHAAGRARTAHVLSRAGDRARARRNRPWRRASCSSRTWAAMRMRRFTGMTRPRAPCACSPTARACTAAWSGAMTAGASHSTARAATASATTSTSPSRLTTFAAAPGVQRLSEELVGARLVARRHQTTDRNFVSANESHLYVLDIATAALTPVSEGSEPASVSQAQFTAEGPRRLPHHQPRQRVRAVAARGPGHRRGGNAHRAHPLGYRSASRAATTAAISPGWRTSMA